MSREWSVRFTVAADNAAGDLTVTGFATRRTAGQLGMRFLDGLRAEYPEAEIRAEILRTDAVEAP